MAYYDYAADYFVRHLERDIEAHEAGRYDEIGLAFDDAPDWALGEENDQEDAHRLGTAYSFWDQWIDARNHDWRYYPDIKQEDWPIIARQICWGLRERWELERIADNAVFNLPPASPRVSLWTRVKRLFKCK